MATQDELDDHATARARHMVDHYANHPNSRYHPPSSSPTFTQNQTPTFGSAPPVRRSLSDIGHTMSVPIIRYDGCGAAGPTPAQAPYVYAPPTSPLPSGSLAGDLYVGTPDTSAPQIDYSAAGAKAVAAADPKALAFQWSRQSPFDADRKQILISTAMMEQPWEQPGASVKVRFATTTVIFNRRIKEFAQARSLSTTSHHPAQVQWCHDKLSNWRKELARWRGRFEPDSKPVIDPRSPDAQQIKQLKLDPAFAALLSYGDIEIMVDHWDSSDARKAGAKEMEQSKKNDTNAAGKRMRDAAVGEIEMGQLARRLPEEGARHATSSSSDDDDVVYAACDAEAKDEVNADANAATEARKRARSGVVKGPAATRKAQLHASLLATQASLIGDSGIKDLQEMMKTMSDRNTALLADYIGLEREKSRKAEERQAVADARDAEMHQAQLALVQAQALQAMYRSK